MSCPSDGVSDDDVHAVPLPDDGGVVIDQKPTEGFGQPVSGSIATLVRSYKSAVTRQINILRGTRGAPVWQRSFYDHIVRSPDDLNHIRQYITENPLKWHLDRDPPSSF